MKTCRMLVALGLLLVPHTRSVGAQGAVLEPSAADSAGRISGRVTFEGTNTPVAGAEITLLLVREPPQPPPSPIFTKTDQGGRFVFDGVAPDAYYIDAEKTGYSPK